MSEQKYCEGMLKVYPEDHKRNVKVTTPKGKKSISTGKKYVINIVYFACEICLISNF